VKKRTKRDNVVILDDIETLRIIGIRARRLEQCGEPKWIRRKYRRVLNIIKERLAKKFEESKRIVLENS
jgi:hypothetical protein